LCASTIGGGSESSFLGVPQRQMISGPASAAAKVRVALAVDLSEAWWVHAFEAGLAELKEKLLTMASHAEGGIARAMEALGKRDYDLALKVQADDSVIDRFEVEVDETSIRLLAEAPKAGNLRLITVAMKISQNLERVGDETTTIARRVQDLCQDVPLKLAVEIPRMAGLAVHMLKSALDAFVNQDPAAARALIPQDKEIDSLNRQIHRQLADQMIRDPDTVLRCLHAMVISKSLERIADHAKNVAEEVVYLCEARDIRHTAAGEESAGEQAGA
jgi:phosphate transport system protein